MNKIDSFFKRKVEEASVQPRPEAWQKLEANLSKKNKGLIWLRIAAAILLAGLFITSIIWLPTKEVAQLSETKKEVPIKKSMDTLLKSSETPSTTILSKKGIDELKHQPRKRKVAPQKPAVDEVNEEVALTVKEDVKIESKEPTPQTASVASIEKPIVIEYTLELLPKKETTVVADATEKKNNLQKAIEFAREAKNSDSPLGGLRQAKDDLFALNFKKDKQKKQ